jgi:hypothetical protein
MLKEAPSASVPKKPEQENFVLLFGEQQTLSSEKSNISYYSPKTCVRKKQKKKHFPQMRNLFSNVAAHTHNILHNIYIFPIIFILQVKQLTEKKKNEEGKKKLL